MKKSFLPIFILAFALAADDFFTWEEVYREDINYVSVLHSPSFPMNRTLYRGYLIPAEYGLLDRLYMSTLPFNDRDPLEFDSVYVTETPEVSFAWQGGLFRGNLLNFRMLRNLSKKLSFGAFVSYSDLKRTNYYHGGGIASLYRTYHRDNPARISIRGYSPYSLMNKVGLEANYSDNIEVNIRYSYADMRQDLAYNPSMEVMPDSSYLNIAYNEAHTYLNQFDASLGIPFGEKFLWKNTGKIEAAFQDEKPITRTINGMYATDELNFEKILQSASSQFYWLPKNNDSVSLNVSTNRLVADSVTHHTKAFMEISSDMKEINGFRIKGSGGSNYIRTNGSTVKTEPTGAFEFSYNIELGSVTAWSKRDLIPMHDKSYVGYGLDFIILPIDMMQILLGYSHLSADVTHIEYFWHITPYISPKDVWTVGFSAGEFKFVSAYTNWMLSDTEPKLRTDNGLKFRFNREGQTRTFYADFAYYYQSKRRDLGEQFGYDQWGRDIHDVSVKLAAEIKDFRVFWKIDNFLNRANSYVPGYIMPGLTFRWGFSWYIFG